VWLLAVAQCPGEMGLYESEEGEDKSFGRGGKGRDVCSPDVRVDILVVGSVGYLAVLSACL